MELSAFVRVCLRFNLMRLARKLYDIECLKKTGRKDLLMRSSCAILEAARVSHKVTAAFWAG